ncbi:hypothetical protein RRG08_030707 [Elysia crispata]|uniref:Uncharacterized protein n=1 Tax=Elysia crispata TaxID=231223 RepID=A0AAE1CS98_9GAST|nr:hypothetical protein RRG08_030707 [Elysia crispata]
MAIPMPTTTTFWCSDSLLSKRGAHESNRDSSSGRLTVLAQKFGLETKTVKCPQMTIGLELARGQPVMTCSLARLTYRELARVWKDLSLGIKS